MRWRFASSLGQSTFPSFAPCQGPRLTVITSGGLHLLFSAQPKHTIHLPLVVPVIAPPKPTDMRYLIQFLKSDLLSERGEMFGDGDGV